MTDDLARRSIATIRALSIDTVQEANSGHPGLPLGMAPAAYLLFQRIMRFDPRDPTWPDRDRFVLSAGHGSALLYVMLHLSGYDVSLDDLRRFRQWGSITPGHPELDHVNVTPGVEVTTGPLGQGFANGVGMALAERFLRERFGKDVQHHHVFAIVSDGDLMEGIASEAASLAGHLRLSRLVYLYDDNDISLDGPTSLAFKEDTTKRFEAYGWHVEEVADVEDLTALEQAIDRAVREDERPSLVRVRSIIGYPSPNKQGTSGAHGAPLGEEEVRLTKEAMGLDPDLRFDVPADVAEHMSQVARGAALQAEWQSQMRTWRERDPDLAAEWDAAWSGRPLPGVGEALRSVSFSKDGLATRVAGKEAMAAMAPFVPTLVGGAADLASSTNTMMPGGESAHYTERQAGRNVYFGVREHGMGGAVNGMAAHGGIVRPYGSTFLQFADYMRGSIRLSALMGLNVAWVFTHDSVGLGEDGPTHQPVEHLAALRAIPHLTVIRPADAAETAEAWRVILEDLDGPGLLALSRQGVPAFGRGAGGVADATGLARGAYVLREAGDARATIVGTGTEVTVALAAADLLGAEGIPARVVSMPSWELFDAQDLEYQEQTIPVELVSVSVEAGITMGWERWVDSAVGIDRFGASAPGPEVLERLGITPEAVAGRVRELLG
ncbi:MAG TPA: transketolase [Solirubrobacteraceae bacterium]|nr:transketolase [Solirubrobacteraceae bacterium]